jgi:PKD repeat protein
MSRPLLFKVAFIVLMLSGIFSSKSISAQCEDYFATINVENAVSCPGGSDGVLSVEVFNGQGPFQYLWSNDATSESVSDLEAGVYSVNVIDVNQCITNALVLLTEPSAFDFNISSNPSGCNATYGELLVSATGGTGNLQFSLDEENWQAGNFSGLEPGLYPVYVVDDLGCEGVTYATVSVVSISANALEVTSNDCNGDCNAVIQGSADLGLPPYAYNWFSLDADGNPFAINQFTNNAVNLCSGYYYAEVTDESGIGGGNPELFWSEDFGVGCNTGQLANGFSSSNGIWTTASTGTNEPFANTFFISATEQMDAGNCGVGCGGNNSRTLHLGNVAALGLLTADGGATYNAGGLCSFGNVCVVTNLRAESPVIDCSGRANIELTMDYIEVGQGLIDNATLWYFDGATWALLVDLPKTLCCGGPCNGSNQGLFTNYSVALPASANNNPNVKIGFNWTNNDDGVGTDPSFAVDNITLTSAGTTSPCTVYTPVVYIDQPDPMQLFVVKFSEITCNGANDGAVEVLAAGGEPAYSYMWSNGVPFSANLDLGPGEYTVTVTDQNDCEIEQTFVVAPDPAAEIVSFDFVANGLTLDFGNNSSVGNYLWDFGDGNTSEVFEPTHTYADVGVYEVCLTLISPCGDQQTCTILTIVSTGVGAESDEFIFSPNPFRSQLRLNFGSGVYDLKIYSALGNLVGSESRVVNQMILNTEAWNSGVYFLHITEVNSGKVFRQNVVKVKD